MPTQHYLADPPELDPTGQPRPASSNRFNWFSRIPPDDGPITDPFTTEFLPGLSTIVGSIQAPFEDAPPQFEVLGYRTVSWDSATFPGLEHIPGLQFSVRTLRPESVPEVIDYVVPQSIAQFPARVLLNRSSSQNTAQPPAGKFRPSLFIDFNRPQRAVGLEFGFKKLQQSPSANLKARGARLIALDRNGQPVRSSAGGILSSTANLISGTLLLTSRVDHQVGVRSQIGEIWSVELRFEHDGDEEDLKIVEQQAVLRIWHEILPPAATLQGTIAIGSVPDGFIPAPPLDNDSVRLPFDCDRAVVLIRGMRQETRAPFPTGIREMGSGFVRSVHAPGRAGVVNLNPFFHYRGSAAAGQPSGLIYYSLLAWNSREVEMAGTEFSDTFSFPENGGNALVDVNDPLPELGYSSNGFPPIFRSETEAKHGPLVPALNGYHFLGTGNFDPLDVIQLETALPWWDPAFLQWGPFDPTQPARRMQLTITSVLADADVPTDRSFTGSILTGRSLRASPDETLAAPENRVWRAMLQGPLWLPAMGVPTFRPPPSDPQRFPLPPEWTAEVGLQFPVRADMAVVGFWAMQFWPAVQNIFVAPVAPRAIEWELLGSGYDGKNVDWRGTGALELNVGSNVLNANHRFDLRPSIFGVSRDWDFATSALSLENNFVHLYAFHQGPAVGGLIMLKNKGRAQVHLQWIYPGNEPGQSSMHYEYELRGERFTNFADRTPLQIRSGETLFIFPIHTPNPATGPTGPEFTRNVTLEIYPSGSAVPLVATTVVTEYQPRAWWLSLPGKQITQSLQITATKRSPAAVTKRVRLFSPYGVRVKAVDIRNVRGGKSASRFSVRVVGGLKPRNAFARKIWDIDVTWTRHPDFNPDSALLVAETFFGPTFTLPMSGLRTQ